MKKMIPLFLIVLLASCKVPFTGALRTSLESNNVDLRKIQFYNSTPFYLQRHLSSAETGITGGRIKITEGVKVEVVRIAKKTPAICDSSANGLIILRFEQGHNREIPFKYDDFSDRYKLINAGRIDPIQIKSYTGYAGSRFYGTIQYGDLDYYYGYILNNQPLLLVKKKQVNKVLRDIRTAKGVKIN
jgi:hypothetical protein